MPRKLPQRRSYWVIGGLIALVGVALARLVSPELSPELQTPAFVAGATLAVIGIFVAAAGAGRHRD